jgi:hypothetical protein
MFSSVTEAALSSQIGIDLRAASPLSNVELSATHTRTVLTLAYPAVPMDKPVERELSRVDWL